MNLREFEAYTQDRRAISQEQEAAIHASGNYVVNACPGSGKTATVAAMLAYRMLHWQARTGIAAVTFTNVAEQEIADRLQLLGFPRYPSPPHFLGTLNSFISQWVFQPFGHLVMSSSGPLSSRPRLVVDYNQDWVCSAFKLPGDMKVFKVADFHWRADDRLVWQKPPGFRYTKQPDLRLAKEAKLRMAAAGYATHSDAMYWSLRVLEKYPILAQSLAHRFSQIIVDEAQDTSDIQLHILRLLSATGLVQMTFVGDPDQCIYGFNQADARFMKKAQRSWSSYPLTANYRSSQLICNATYHFSGQSQVTVALGPSKDCAWKPQLVRYDDSKIEEVRGTFQGILDRFGIKASEGVIVTTRNSDVSKILGRKKGARFPAAVWESTRGLVRASQLVRTGDLEGATKLTEQFLIGLGFDPTTLPPQDDNPYGLPSRQWRVVIWQAVQSLPNPDSPLSVWLIEARKALHTVLSEHGLGNIALSRRFPVLKSAEADSPAGSFIDRETTMTSVMVKTIHQAKGETHTATMVVATPSTKKGKSEVYQWFTPPDSTGLRPEDVRRAYVGMTRPRVLLVVAIPTSAWEDNYRRFQGFEVVI